MTLKKLVPNSTIRSIPGGTWNRMVDHIAPRAGGVYSKPLPPGGGGGGPTGGGGSSLRLGYVFDDFPGYTPGQELNTTPGTVRCLYKDRDGSGYTVETGIADPASPITASYPTPHDAGAVDDPLTLVYDEDSDSWSVGTGSVSAAVEVATAFSATDTTISVKNAVVTNNSFPGFILAEPAFGLQIDLDSGAIAEAREIIIDLPIMSDNRVDGEDDANEAVVVSGRGATYGNEVAVLFPSPVGQKIADVSENGVWCVKDVDVSGLPRGPIAISVTETDIDDFVSKPVLAVFTNNEGLNQSKLNSILPTPTFAPNLKDASDTGESNTDNVTAETELVFTMEATDAPDATGPVPVLYADGVEIARGDVNSFASTVPYLAELTTPTLAEGTHRITYTLMTYDPGTTATTQYESGHSPATVVVVDSTAEDTVLTATVAISADFTVDDLIPIDPTSAVVFNPAGVTVPAIPSTLPQPETLVKGSEDDVINIKYQFSTAEWVYDRVEKYCREVVIGTVGSVPTITTVSPCRYLVPEKVAARLTEDS